MALTARLGVDVGGTFNDYVLETGGKVLLWKELGDPSRSAQILRSIRRLRDNGNDVAEFLYGSTTALNALLERKHRRPVLLTTAGFEDVLDLRRQQRVELYQQRAAWKPALVPRRMRIGLHERIDAQGKVIHPLVPEEVRRIALKLPPSVRAVAVSFLHSYANPIHEIMVEETIAKVRPDVACILSSRLVSEIREFERTSTVTAAAYLLPIVGAHLNELAHKVEFTGRRSAWVMQSAGGRISFDKAAENSTQILLSGPAAGVIGAQQIARLAGYQDLITLDVGGTSADVALIRDGKASMVYDRMVDGLPLLGASVDVHSVGAGGGSIIRIDSGGYLRVGPESAGANPGPACYGRGGTQPTLSDAHVILGNLPSTIALAGSVPISRQLAVTALAKVSAQLDTSVEEVAVAAVDIAVSNMVNAIRLISVERGYNPRDYTLVGFGGAGPLHAFEIARQIGSPRVFVPYAPGVVSALGLLAAPIRADTSRSIIANEDQVNLVESTIKALTRNLRQTYTFDRHNPPAVVVNIDTRYVGQNWQIPIAVSGPVSARSLRKAFEDQYRGQYGIVLNRPLQYVTVRVALVTAPRPLSGRRNATAQPSSRTPEHVRMYSGGKWRTCDLWFGAAPKRGIVGPGLLGLSDSTVLIPDGAKLTTVRGGYVLEPL